GRRLLRKHHRLDGEEIDAALGEGLGLLGERRFVFLVGDALVERVVLGQPTRGPDGACDEAAARRDGAPEPRAFGLELSRAIAELVLVELQARAAERVCLDDVAARAEVALVDPGHHVGVRVVPQLRARAVEQPGGEEHRAVAAVEHERVAPLDALDDLPAARLAHAETATPSTALASTTASVESLA